MDGQEGAPIGRWGCTGEENISLLNNKIRNKTADRRRILEARAKNRKTINNKYSKTIDR